MQASKQVNITPFSLQLLPGRTSTAVTVAGHLRGLQERQEPEDRRLHQDRAQDRVLGEVPGLQGVGIVIFFDFTLETGCFEMLVGHYCAFVAVVVRCRHHAESINQMLREMTLRSVLQVPAVAEAVPTSERRWNQTGRDF